MLQAATDLGLVTESEASSSAAATEEDDDFIFTEDVEISQKPTQNKAELECLHYFEDQRKDLASLEQYPLIKQLFVRFNTSIPSSAPVERLFSFAGLINRPHRRSLNATLFEKLVVLKGISYIAKETVVYRLHTHARTRTHAKFDCFCSCVLCCMVGFG